MSGAARGGWVVAASIGAVEALKDQLGFCKWNYVFRSMEQRATTHLALLSKSASLRVYAGKFHLHSRFSFNQHLPHWLIRISQLGTHLHDANFVPSPTQFRAPLHFFSAFVLIQVDRPSSAMGSSSDDFSVLVLAVLVLASDLGVDAQPFLSSPPITPTSMHSISSAAKVDVISPEAVYFA